MSLISSLSSAVSSIFNAVGDVAKTAEYIDVEEYDFDPTNPRDAIEISHPIKKLIRTEFSEKDIDGAAVKHGDIIALVQTKELSVTPSQEDAIIIDCVRWSVISWSTDPAGVHYRFHLRGGNSELVP